MDKIKRILLKTVVICLNLVYGVFKLLPSPKKIVFLSRQFDNVSVDFDMISSALLKADSTWKVVFLTKRIKKSISGLIGYCFHMLSQMYHLATAQVAVIDGYCIAVSALKHKKTLSVIQIWHAIGCMKKFGYAMIGQEEGTNPDVAEIMKMHRNYDWALISSFSFINDYLEGFRISRDKILQIPLPKADLLTDSKYLESQKKRLTEKYPQLKEKKNILYCPTFRKDGSLEEKGITDLIAAVDFDKFNLLYKPHPNSKAVIDNPDVMLFSESTMEILPVSDYVISDYSSVMYEAGLAGKPVFLYAYDWKTYSQKRSFNLDLEKDVPTIFTGNPEEIIKVIEEDKFDYKRFDEFIKKNVAIPEEGCTKAIVNLILSEKERKQ